PVPGHPPHFPTRPSSDLVAGVAQLHELARLVADVDLLEADEHADAVVHVDDVVADLEVAEIGQEGACRRLPPLRDGPVIVEDVGDRKSTRLNSSHVKTSY